MPLYEYQCDACGHRFEKIVKFSDPPLELCPECGGAVQKLLSSPAIQFKGSGWYITDYAKKPSGDPAGSNAPAKSSGDKTADTGKTADAGSSSKSSEPAAPAAPATKE